MMRLVGVRNKSSLTLLGLCLALGVTFSACQAPVGPQEPSATASSADTPHVSYTRGVSGAQVGAEDLVQSSPRTEAPSDFPLVEYWAAVQRIDERIYSADNDRAALDQWNARESSLAECMKAKGFMFLPRPFTVDAEDDRASVAGEGDFLDVSRLPVTRMEAERVGYGIDPKPRPEKVVVDPNQKYVASLSQREAAEYRIALDGVDFDAPGYDPHAKRQDYGCGGRAESDHPDQRQSQTAVKIHDQHGDVITDLFMFSRGPGQLAEPRIRELNRSWRLCMAGKGFRPEQPKREGTSLDGPSQAVIRARLTDPSGNVGDLNSSTLPDDQTRLVGSSPERRIALDDYDCRVETDYLKVFTAVQRAREEAFVKSHREALDAMVAAANGLA